MPFMPHLHVAPRAASSVAFRELQRADVPAAVALGLLLTGAVLLRAPIGVVLCVMYGAALFAAHGAGQQIEVADEALFALESPVRVLVETAGLFGAGMLHVPRASGPAFLFQVAGFNLAVRQAWGVWRVASAERDGEVHIRSRLVRRASPGIALVALVFCALIHVALVDTRASALYQMHFPLTFLGWAVAAMDDERLGRRGLTMLDVERRVVYDAARSLGLWVAVMTAVAHIA